MSLEQARREGEPVAVMAAAAGPTHPSHWERWRLPALLAIVGVLAISVAANVVGLYPLPGGALAPAGSGPADQSTVGLLPYAGREPGKPWVASVVLENYSDDPWSSPTRNW
jgi:hypothetical protein